VIQLKNNTRKDSNRVPAFLETVALTEAQFAASALGSGLPPLPAIPI
jgi:hypothetical protein